jgi:NAD(P)-dependent dehydrogenase (short-subunit alcohol dehydrogenase family)
VESAANQRHSAYADGLGPVHVLVNCAGVALWKPALEVTEAEWDRLLAVDLKGTWLISLLTKSTDSDPIC